MRVELARRCGVHPQALAQTALGLRRAKGQLAGAQLVEHDADGKNIAARVASHAHHLLRRNPGGRAHGFAQLLGQQVGVQGVAGQTKVQQHGATIGANQHIGRLQVQVHGVLLVQAVHRQRHRRTQTRQCFHGRAFGQVKPVLQGLPRHIFHHQVRHMVEVTCGHKARHVRAADDLQHLVLDLEADDVLGTVARRHARNFHGQRKAGVARAFGVAHAVNMRHAAGVDAFFNGETVQLCTGHQQLHRPVSSRSAKKAGKPACRIAAAADWWS